jgi:hypothetical protein
MFAAVSGTRIAAGFRTKTLQALQPELSNPPPHFNLRSRKAEGGAEDGNLISELLVRSCSHVDARNIE